MNIVNDKNSFIKCIKIKIINKNEILMLFMPFIKVCNRKNSLRRLQLQLRLPPKFFGIIDYNYVNRLGSNRY